MCNNFSLAIYEMTGMGRGSVTAADIKPVKRNRILSV